MPVMDGVQTLHAIRALEGNPSADVPVIALTANAVAGAREFYLKEGFQDYLTKPIEADKFENMLIEYLPDNVVYLTTQFTDAGELDRIDDEIGLGLKESRLYKIGFNIRHGLKYMGGNHALYAKVLRDFHTILSEKEGALAEFLRKGDMPGFRIIVHSLKGNARNLGADDLADEAFELEKLSKAERLEDVEVRAPILFSMMRNMKNELQEYLEEEDKEQEQQAEPKEEKKKAVTQEEWEQGLRQLAERLDDFDADSVETKLAELRSYERPEEDCKMLRMCEKAVKDYAYDVALEIVNTVLKV